MLGEDGMVGGGETCLDSTLRYYHPLRGRPFSLRPPTTSASTQQCVRAVRTGWRTSRERDLKTRSRTRHRVMFINHVVLLIFYFLSSASLYILAAKLTEDETGTKNSNY